MAHCRLWALALRGFNKNHAGKPVARARSPIYPVPNSAVSSPSRRVMRLVMVYSPSKTYRHGCRRFAGEDERGTQGVTCALRGSALGMTLENRYGLCVVRIGRWVPHDVRHHAVDRIDRVATRVDGVRGAVDDLRGEVLAEL